jgi:hypothetical protein
MRRWFIGSILVLGCVVAAEAAPVNELELDGTATNNSLAIAETIPTSAFTLPVPATVFNPPGFPTAALTGFGGGEDVDIFRISGHGRLILDVDNGVNGDFLSFIDTELFLYNSSGVLLTFNEDGPNDPGTLHTHDSLIFFDLPGPGVYFVGIRDELHTGNGPQPTEGAQEYLLFLSLEHPHRVPVPATLVLLGVGLGILALTRGRVSQAQS